MTLVKAQNFNFQKIINFLLSLIPFSFIAGNLFINLNIALIIIVSLIFWKLRFFKIKYFFIDKILILFFLLTIIVNLINISYFLSIDFNLAKENFLKSIFFFRYLLFYIAIRHVVEKNIFDFKIFFISSSLCIIFVSLDLIYQFTFGSDFFGLHKTQYHSSGPFGDELIAGSYLQRFGIFIFFLFPFLRNKLEDKYSITILIFLFLIIFFSIIISGNRMPTVLFVMFFLILLISEKRLRKFFITIVPLICIFFLLIYNLNSQISTITDHFLKTSYQILTSFNEVFSDSNIKFTNMYLKEFNLGYLTWKENIFFGGGINSFYLNCKINYDFCSNHPHNYYLEILSELGIIGLLLITIFFTSLLYFYFILKSDLCNNFNQNLIIPFTLIFFIEIFPIKTSGSFFTTGNASYIFFIIAVMVGLINNMRYSKS